MPKPMAKFRICGPKEQISALLAKMQQDVSNVRGSWVELQGNSQPAWTKWSRRTLEAVVFAGSFMFVLGVFGMNALAMVVITTLTHIGACMLADLMGWEE